ncbi:MAG: arginine-tRNA-protein transferase [Spirochaetes bacterium]|nr:MAG: arginine-tRNA-protein transferase [Spirochaetota bacterium]
MDYHLSRGWRRAGAYFYRYRCQGCSLCIPLRLVAANPLESHRRRKRLESRNKDIEIVPSSHIIKEEWIGLLARYAETRHETPADEAEETLYSFLASPYALPLEYRDRAGKLVGLSFLEKGIRSLSSVYFAFAPEEAGRSLGTYSVFRETEAARAWGFSYYYLGFWVPGSRKMDYKADFHPFEILTPCGKWQGFMDRGEDALPR